MVAPRYSVFSGGRQPRGPGRFWRARRECFRSRLTKATISSEFFAGSSGRYKRRDSSRILSERSTTRSRARRGSGSAMRPADAVAAYVARHPGSPPHSPCSGQRFVVGVSVVSNRLERQTSGREKLKAARPSSRPDGSLHLPTVGSELR